MNGNWFPWCEGVNGNQPGEYVAAWRHVHDIFTAVGATNATWVWCPNVDPEQRHAADLAAPLPGRRLRRLDLPRRLQLGQPAAELSFNELFKPTYDAITDTIAPRKPMIIGEIGSTEYGRLQGASGSPTCSRRCPTASRRSAACCSSTSSTTAWTGRSRPARRHRRLRGRHRRLPLPGQRLRGAERAERPPRARLSRVQRAMPSSAPARRASCVERPAERVGDAIGDAVARAGT